MKFSEYWENEIKKFTWNGIYGSHFIWQLATVMISNKKCLYSVLEQNDGDVTNRACSWAHRTCAIKISFVLCWVVVVSTTSHPEFTSQLMHIKANISTILKDKLHMLPRVSCACGHWIWERERDEEERPYVYI